MGSEALCFLIIHLSMHMYMCVCAYVHAQVEAFSDWLAINF